MFCGETKAANLSVGLMREYVIGGSPENPHNRIHKPRPFSQPASAIGVYFPSSPHNHYSPLPPASGLPVPCKGSMRSQWKEQ